MLPSKTNTKSAVKSAVNSAGKGLPQWVERGLEEDPVYRVVTMDGLGWIDPFSGELVSAPGDYEEAARQHLLRSNSWRTGAARPLRELLYLRWLHYLRPHIKDLPQLRVIRSERWLNPYTGKWQAAPPEDWQADLMRFADFLAGVLCDCPEAQDGRMLERWQLESLSTQGPHGGDPGPLVVPGAAPGAVSGSGSASSGSRSATSSSASRTATPVAPRRASSSGDRPAVPPVARTATPIGIDKVAQPLSQPSGHAPAQRQTMPDATPSKGVSITGHSKMKTDLIGIRQAFIKQLRKPPRIEGYQMVLQFAPHATIPRDFYDVVQPNADVIHLIMGHVNGDGPGVSLLAGAMLDACRSVGGQHADPVEVLCQLNDEVRVDQLPGCSVAMCILSLRPADKRVRCVVAGHLAPVIVSARRDSVLRQFRGGGAPLGSLRGADFRKKLQPIETELAAGDIIALMGAGLAHAADANDPDAGRYRVYGHLVAHVRKPLADMVQAVMQDVRGDAKPRDDLALLALRTKDESWLLEVRDE